MENVLTKGCLFMSFFLFVFIAIITYTENNATPILKFSSDLPNLILFISYLFSANNAQNIDFSSFSRSSDGFFYSPIRLIFPKLQFLAASSAAFS
jgi:hypothetical protein